MKYPLRNDELRRFRINLLKAIKERKERMTKKRIIEVLQKRFPGHKIEAGPDYISIGQLKINYDRARELAAE